MWFSITLIYCDMWMSSFVSITMQRPCYSGYISPSHLNTVLSSQTYLGTKLCKTRLHNEVWAWVISSVKYVKRQSDLAANYGGRFKLPKKTEYQLKMGYDQDPDAVSY